MPAVLDRVLVGKGRRGPERWVWAPLAPVEQGLEESLARITSCFRGTEGILTACPARGDGTLPRDGAGPTHGHARGKQCHSCSDL